MLEYFRSKRALAAELAEANKEIDALVDKAADLTHDVRFWKADSANQSCKRQEAERRHVDAADKLARAQASLAKALDERDAAQQRAEKAEAERDRRGRMLDLAMGAINESVAAYESRRRVFNEMVVGSEWRPKSSEPKPTCFDDVPLANLADAIKTVAAPLQVPRPTVAVDLADGPDMTAIIFQDGDLSRFSKPQESSDEQRPVGSEQRPTP